MQDELFLQWVKGQSNPGADKGNTDDPELKMMMLAHWLGDIHQPLHVDLNCDEGGNFYNVLWYGNTTCGDSPYDTKYPCNLHKVWDSTMIQKRLLAFGAAPPWNSTEDDPREEMFGEYLVTRMDLMFNATAQGPPTSRAQAAIWATDSIMLASMSYLVEAGFNVDDHYVNHAMPIVELQLWRAGFRIASVLNYIFGGKVKDCPACKWWEPLCRPVDNYVQPSKCSIGNTTSLGRLARK
jgi:hypothetical protein